MQTSGVQSCLWPIYFCWSESQIRVRLWVGRFQPNVLMATKWLLATKPTLNLFVTPNEQSKAPSFEECKSSKNLKSLPYSFSPSVQRAIQMARTGLDQHDNKIGSFFLATLLLWFVSVWFEILFNKRRELLFIVAGCCFYQIANWVIRFLLSRDPLFVNTSVSLLHSTLTSVSGSYFSIFPLWIGFQQF